MTVAVPLLPSQQLAALNDAYRAAMMRKRIRFTVASAIFAAALMIAAIGAEVNLATFVAKIGNFVSYFDRIATLESGARVWTNIGEWFWGWRKWLALLGETILISYVGTLAGAVLAFALNFLAAENTSPRLAAFRRQAADGILPHRSGDRLRAAVRRRVRIGSDARRAGARHPYRGRTRQAVRRGGGEHRHEAGRRRDCDRCDRALTIRYAVLPQVLSTFASYTLLRFEFNVRGASILGFVGAGGIGQDLMVAIRKFYYSDVSAILVLIIATVVVIDLATERVRHRLIGLERRG